MIVAIMNLDAFKDSVAGDAPPAGTSLALQALWWDAKGDWNKAHECAQAQEDDEGNWVHAYLHRREGDAANAGYWYRRVRKDPATVPLAAEWDAIAGALLGAGVERP
ncbi:MAG TPA: hypothetical protein VMQ73_00655 [Methylomirabilota bacterium]|nr:hypothetical protein [Methylomirabilota bacterium]